MRSDTFFCMSSGDGGVEPALEAASLLRLSSMVLSAELSVLSSDELISPDLTIDSSVLISGECRV